MRTEILQVPGKPYLIQRGTFKSVNGDAIEGIDSLINYDYMGSSEFEWGALPQSLNRMVSYWGSYVMVETPLKDLDSQLCYLLCYDKHSDVVRETLGILFSKEGREKIYTKEWTDMYLYISGTLSSYLKTDFWWDVENDWMCCFGLYNLQRLIRAMRLVCRKKAQKIKNCTTCSHAILCAKVELKDHKEICIQKGYEYHLVKFSTFPEVGPKEIDGSHFKPQRTLIEKDGPS